MIGIAKDEHGWVSQQTVMARQRKELIRNVKQRQRSVQI